MAACVDRPPLNKDMSGIPTALNTFLPESRVNLPGLERLQDRYSQDSIPQSEVLRL